MSLLFNMLSRLVIAFLPKSKHLLISWLKSPSEVILEPPKIKFVTIFPSICHEVMLGKIEGKRRKGRQRMSWFDGITDSMDMGLLKLWETEAHGSLACCSSWGHKESDMIEGVNSSNRVHSQQEFESQ